MRTQHLYLNLDSIWTFLKKKNSKKHGRSKLELQERKKKMYWEKTIALSLQRKSPLQASEQGKYHSFW